MEDLNVTAIYLSWLPGSLFRGGLRKLNWGVSRLHRLF